MCITIVMIGRPRNDLLPIEGTLVQKKSGHGLESWGKPREGPQYR